MAIIDPGGLFNGDRMAKLSLPARLYWPYFYVAANGAGRIEINYFRFAATMFSRFPAMPSEQEVMSHLKEYSDNYLLFIYRAQGSIWGQFDTSEKFLTRHKDRATLASPDPGPAFTQWKSQYVKVKEAESRSNPIACNVFGNSSELVPKMFGESSATFTYGVGVGVGVGVGETQCASPNGNAGVDGSLLPLSKIRLDGGTQPRSIIDCDAVDDYLDAMKDGAKFPPLVVFYDGSDYWLADGFHRRAAAFGAELDEIACDVRQGTREDAQWFSFSANKANGLRRTSDDKQRVIKAALTHPHGVGKSDLQLAQHVGVSGETVRLWREKLEPKGLFAVDPIRAVQQKDTELKTLQMAWFTAWYADYWLHKGKQDGWVAFARHVKTEARYQEVMAATRAQKPEMLARPPAKRPHPATWLNGKRWEDEVETAQIRAEATADDYPELQ